MDNHNMSTQQERSPLISESSHVAFSLPFLLFLACWYLFCSIDDKTTSGFVDSQAYLLLANVSFLWLFLTRRVNATVMLLMMAVGIVSAMPVYSDDHFRYFAEGQALLAGINPYRTAPADYSFDSWAVNLVNHSEYPAIYPPLFIVLMAAVSSLGIGVMGYQTLLLLALVFSGVCLSRCGVERRQVLLLVAPFVLIEGVWSMHNDLLGALLLLWSVMALQKNRYRSSLLLLGCSVGIKWISAVVIPLLLWKVPAKYRVPALCWFLAPLLLSCIPFYLPGILDEQGIVSSSFSAFARSWEFNSPLYQLLTTAGCSREIVKLLLLVMYTAIYCGILVIRMPIERKVVLVMALLPLASAVAHPWYFLWAVVLSVLSPSYTLLALSFSLPWAYEVLGAYHTSGVWEEDWRVTTAVWGLPLLVWSAQLTRGLSSKFKNTAKHAGKSGKLVDAELSRVSS